jgi:O-antigen/teichoic acid export membrane protein
MGANGVIAVTVGSAPRRRERGSLGRLGRNVVSNLIGQVLIAALVLAAGRFLYHSLGGDAFGIVFFGLTLASALSAACDLGLGTTAVREVAAHHEQQPGYVIELLRTAGLLCWVAFAALALSLVLAAPWFVNGWIRLSDLAPERAVHALRLVAVGGLLALPRSLYASTLRGLQRMDLSNAIDVAAQVVQQSGTVLMVRTNASLEALVAWLALSQLLWCTAQGVAVALLLGARSLLLGWETSAVRRNLRFGGHLTLLSLLAVVHTQLERMITSHLLPVAVFGYYTFGYGGVARATVLTGAVANAAYPSFAALFALGDRERLMSRYHALQELVCLGGAPLFAAVPFLVRPVATLIFDVEVASSLTIPLTLVAIGFYLNGTLTVPHVFSLAAGRPDIAVQQNLIALPIVLPLTAILVGRFGLAGAGASWVAYQLLGYAWGARRVSRECMHIPFGRWLRPAAQAVALALLTYGPLLVLMDTRSVGRAVAAYLIATSLFAAGAGVLAGPELRAAARRVAASLVPARLAGGQPPR